ncbi:hypothetical protein GBAR_LOCUS24548, partial [Geodia barretti]
CSRPSSISFLVWYFFLENRRPISRVCSSGSCQVKYASLNLFVSGSKVKSLFSIPTPRECSRCGRGEATIMEETEQDAVQVAGPLSVKEEEEKNPPLEEGEEREEGEEVKEDEVCEEEEGGGTEDRGPSDVITVRVLAYSKTEEDIFYNIEVIVNDGKPLLLHRRYEEIRWVYRLLANNVDIGGNILPPLPFAPTPVPAHLEQLGVPQSSMFGGHSRLPCLDVESFLQSLADHPFFSLNHEVHTFLTSPQLPPRDPLPSPSLWDSLSSAYTNYQLSSLQDTDDDFVELLRGLNERAPVLETCSRHFGQLVTAWQSERGRERR